MRVLTLSQYRELDIFAVLLYLPISRLK